MPSEKNLTQQKNNGRKNLCQPGPADKFIKKIDNEKQRQKKKTIKH